MMARGAKMCTPRPLPSGAVSAARADRRLCVAVKDAPNPLTARTYWRGIIARNERVRPCHIRSARSFSRRAERNLTQVLSRNAHAAEIEFPYRPRKDVRTESKRYLRTGAHCLPISSPFASPNLNLIFEISNASARWGNRACANWGVARTQQRQLGRIGGLRRHFSPSAQFGDYWKSALPKAALSLPIWVRIM